jgi:hypothetical protein
VLALIRARPDLYTLERAVLLVGSWDHLRVLTQPGEESVSSAPTASAPWGDVTAALVQAPRLQGKRREHRRLAIWGETLAWAVAGVSGRSLNLPQG